MLTVWKIKDSHFTSYISKLFKIFITMYDFFNCKKVKKQYINSTKFSFTQKDKNTYFHLLKNKRNV